MVIKILILVLLHLVVVVVVVVVLLLLLLLLLLLHLVVVVLLLHLLLLSRICAIVTPRRNVSRKRSKPSQTVFSRRQSLPTFKSMFPLKWPKNSWKESRAEIQVSVLTYFEKCRSVHVNFQSYAVFTSDFRDLKKTNTVTVTKISLDFHS